MLSVLAILCRLASIDVPPAVEMSADVAASSREPAPVSLTSVLTDVPAVPLEKSRRDSGASVRLAQHSVPLAQHEASTRDNASAFDLQEIMRIRRETSPLRDALPDDEFSGLLQPNSQSSGTGTSGRSSSMSEAEYRRFTIRSLRRRLHAIADDLEVLEYDQAAGQIRSAARELGAHPLRSTGSSN